VARETVGVADPSRNEANQHLAGAGLVDLESLQFERLVLRFDDRRGDLDRDS
jgi:hypothetical protein